MPGPSGWHHIVRPTNKPTAASRQPATYGVSHKKRHYNQQRNQHQQHHHVNRRQLMNHPLWNGFINVPRIEQQASNQQPWPVQRAPQQQQQQQYHHRQSHAPNPRFLARLNNDLKQLWQASPVDQAAYTASTSLPDFSNDVPFSDSLFRVPMRPLHQPATTAYRHDQLMQPPPPALMHDFTTPNRTPAPGTPDAMMMDFSSGSISSNIGRNVFIAGSDAKRMRSLSPPRLADDDFNISTSLGDQTGLFGDEFAAMQTAADERQRRMRGLSVCRRDSISIQSTLPPPGCGRICDYTTQLSSTYAEMSASLRAAFQQCRRALYADGTYTDLATLRRRACQTKRGRTAVQDDAASAAYDPCPFSPMTMMGGLLDGSGDCVTVRAATTGGSLSGYFDQHAEDSLLMEADADSGCPSFGFDEDDACDIVDDSSDIDSPLF